ncbi:MAG TPA: hypothetical protein VHU13_04585 [Solirubrobacteraceae bacterium]|jgi:hypothetical protein|nr:hypothetical protein [Solirubrobacteraceae bacterium]
MSGRAEHSADEHDRRVATLRLTLVVLLALALVMPAALTLGSDSARAADGLAPGVPLPAWARSGRWVHFDPAVSAATPATPRAARAHAAQPSSPGAAQPSVSGQALTYDGGPVENEPKLVLIFWGKGWGSGRGVELRGELEAMADGLAGSGYQALLGQYSSVEGPISAGPPLDAPRVETYDDTRALPGELEAEAFRTEAAEIVKSAYGDMAANTVFAVLPEPGASYPSSEFFLRTCGWHEAFETEHNSAREVGAYAALIDTGGKFGCYSSKTLSHEYAESVTDPTGNGWRSGAEEIADVCNSLNSQHMADGALVNALWDDSKNACAVEDDAPARAPIGPYTRESYEGNTNLTLESEMLKSDLEPCGLEAHYRFEYGTSTAYGQSTPETTLPPTWGEVHVQATLTGLQHGVHYDWRVVLTTADGTVVGNNHEFTIPYYVETWTEAATGIRATSADLHGSVEPAGRPNVVLLRIRHQQGVRVEDG